MVGRYPAQDSKLKCLAPGGDTSALRPASHLILRPRADLVSQEEGVPTPCAECGLAQCVATSGKGLNDAGHTGAVSKPALVRVSREPLPNSGSIARVAPTRIGCPRVRALAPRLRELLLPRMRQVLPRPPHPDGAPAGAMPSAAAGQHATPVLAVELGPELRLALALSALMALEVSAGHPACAPSSVLLRLATLRRIAPRPPHKGWRGIFLSCLPRSTRP